MTAFICTMLVICAIAYGLCDKSGTKNESNIPQP
jgi:hypothetical protein